MNDEAFLRSLIDSPGVDAPRLVYADWLEERGDPRGDYLRAELEAVRRAREGQGDPNRPQRLRELAEGLDPVWVARVSRPPAGVCCDRVRFDCRGVATGPPLSDDDLRAFEARHKVVLPAEYRAFLLNWNGGYPYPNEIELGDDPDDTVSVDEFLRVDPGPGTPKSLPGCPSPIWEVLSDPFEARGRMIPLASAGEAGFFLSTGGARPGQVFYHGDLPHSEWEENLVPAAASLPEFLDSLMTNDPVWAQLIIRGETDGFVQWLGSPGADPNAVAERNDFTVLMYAIEWKRVDIIRWLLARGARVTKHVRQLAGYRDSRAVAALIDEALKGRKP